jgi:hypothetical protein
MRSTTAVLRSLTPVVLLIVCSAAPLQAGRLAWPVRGSAFINGTFGDARYVDSQWMFHGGVDIEKSVGSSIYAAKASLVVDQQYETNAGHVYKLRDTSTQHVYVYGHVNRIINPATGRYWDYPDVVPDTLTPFCTVWDFPTTDHVEFQVWPSTMGDPTNPIWQDSDFDYLPVSSSPGPKIKNGYDYEQGIAYGHCGFVGGLCEPDEFFCPLKVWSGTSIDVYVYANTKSGTGGPVGVCRLEMWYEKLQVGLPNDPPALNWPYKMELIDGLPSNSYATYVFGITPPGYQPSDSCRVLPTTIQSTNDDQMWYAITNFDQFGNVAPEGCIGSPADSLHEVYYWMWLRVTDHRGSSVTYGPIRVEVKRGPAGFLTSFDATSTDLGIELTWTPQAGLTATGFRVCRGDSALGSFEPIEGAWIPCQCEHAERGQQFTYLDTRVALGTSYWYRLDMLAPGGEWSQIEDIVKETWSPANEPAKLTLKAGPNPFIGFTTIYLGGSSTGACLTRLRLLDCTGRDVWSSTVEGSGNAALKWDPLGEIGKRAAPGIYFCCAERDGQAKKIKLVFLK